MNDTFANVALLGLLLPSVPNVWIYRFTGKTFFWTSFDVFWTWTLFMDLTTFLLEMATLLLDLRTLLLDLRALLLDLALPQTTPPWDRFSKLRLDRNSSDSTGMYGARAVLPCNTADSISAHCVVQCLLPFSALFSTPTFHTSSGLSQLRRGSTGCLPG